MTRQSHLIFLPLLSAALLAGCAGSKPTSTASNWDTDYAAGEDAAEPTMSVEEVFGTSTWPEQVASTNGDFQPPRSLRSTLGTADSRKAATTRSRRTAGTTELIGLYGEAISKGEKTDNDRPGRANIAQVSFAAEGACFDPAINRQGTHLAFASTMHQTSSDIYIKSVSGTTVTQITSDPADDVMPTYHPDGERIAFASNRSGQWNIYLTSNKGGAPIQITNDPDPEIHPTFSPDGRMLAYSKYSSQSGRWEIWAVEIENPGVRQFLEYGMFPQWSPDVASSKILFQRARQRGSRLHGIWTIDYKNGEAVNPTEIVSAANAAVINPSWSPDGRRIVFVSVVDPDRTASERPAQSDIWVINIDGSGRTMLTDNQFANFQPIWSSDGRVYFVSDRSGVDNIWAISTSREDMLRGGTGLAGVDDSRNR